MGNVHLIGGCKRGSYFSRADMAGVLLAQNGLFCICMVEMTLRYPINPACNVNIPEILSEQPC